MHRRKLVDELRLSAMSDPYPPDPSYPSRGQYESGAGSVPPPAPGTYVPPPMQGMYGQPTYAMMAPKSTNGFAIASLVLGISSLPFCYGGILTGILGFILGLVGLRQINADPDRIDGKGLAIAGIVVSIVATLIWGFFLLVVLIAALAEA